MALGGGCQIRRRPKPFTMLPLLLLLLSRYSSPPISCQSFSGDSSTFARARLAIPFTTFSTAMTHGRSQLAEACGRSILSRLLISSSRLSSEGLKPSLGGNGREPAPVLFLPQFLGLMYQRLFPSLARDLYRLEAAIFTGGWDPLHTGLFIPSSQELRTVDHMLFKAPLPNWFLTSTAEKLLLRSSYLNTRPKRLYLLVILKSSPQASGRGMVFVGLYGRVSGAMRRWFYLTLASYRRRRLSVQQRKIRQSQ